MIDSRIFPITRELHRKREKKEEEGKKNEESVNSVYNWDIQSRLLTRTCRGCVPRWRAQSYSITRKADLESKDPLASRLIAKLPNEKVYRGKIFKREPNALKRMLRCYMRECVVEFGKISDNSGRL